MKGWIKLKYFKLNLLVVTIFLLSYPINLYSKQIAPYSKTINKLNITVDPRTELIGVIEVLAQWEGVVELNSPYSKIIQEYFMKYLNDENVKRILEIFNLIIQCI